MDVKCEEVLDSGCEHVIVADSPHELAAEVVAHTGLHHRHELPGTSDSEVAAHHALVLRRVQDLLAGGPGTPV